MPLVNKFNTLFYRALQNFNNYSIAKYLFLFGMLPTIMYQLRIHNYKFEHPHSRLLLYISLGIFFISCFLLLKSYFKDKNLTLNLREIFVEYKRLYIGAVATFFVYAFLVKYGVMVKIHKMPIILLLVFLTNIMLFIINNQNLTDIFIKWDKNKKIYTAIIIPYLIIISIFFFPGMFSNDVNYMLSQSSGVVKVNNWHSTLIIYSVRLFLPFGLLTSNLIVKVVIYLYSSYVLANVFKKYTKLIYVFLLYFPINNLYLINIMKDSEATLFIYVAVVMLIYVVKNNKIGKYYYFGILSLLIAVLSRYNSITQVFILLIPYVIIFIKLKTNFKLNIIRVMVFAVTVSILFLVIKAFVIENKNYVIKTDPFSYNKVADNIRFHLMENNNKFEYNNNYSIPTKKWNKVENYCKKMSFPTTCGYWKLPHSNLNISFLNWLKLVWNHKKDFISTRYKVAKNFFKTNAAVNFFYFNTTLNPKYNLTLPYRDKLRFNVLYPKSHIIRKIRHIARYLMFFIRYKYFFIINLSIIFLWLLFSNYKIFDIKNNLTLATYFAITNICLFIPLVILTPMGWEGRYLAQSIPITIIELMLLLEIILPKINAYIKTKKKL